MSFQTVRLGPASFAEMQDPPHPHTTNPTHMWTSGALERLGHRIPSSKWYGIPDHPQCPILALNFLEMHLLHTNGQTDNALRLSKNQKPNHLFHKTMTSIYNFLRSSTRTNEIGLGIRFHLLESIRHELECISFPDRTDVGLISLRAQSFKRWSSAVCAMLPVSDVTIFTDVDESELRQDLCVLIRERRVNIIILDDKNIGKFYPQASFRAVPFLWRPPVSTSLKCQVHQFAICLDTNLIFDSGETALSTPNMVSLILGTMPSTFINGHAFLADEVWREMIYDPMPSGTIVRQLLSAVPRAINYTTPRIPQGFVFQRPVGDLLIRLQTEQYERAGGYTTIIFTRDAGMSLYLAAANKSVVVVGSRQLGGCAVPTTSAEMVDLITYAVDLYT